MKPKLFRKNNYCRQFKLTAIGLLALAFAGCEEKQEGDEKPTLTASPTSIAANAAAGNYSIAVTSNTSWTAEVEDAATHGWCTITSGTKGSEDGTITLRTAQNTVTEERYAIITITAGALTRQVAVTQAAAGTTPDDPDADPTLTVNPETIPATSASGSYSIAVTSNTTWTAAVNSGATWCTLANANATGNGTVTVNVAANTATVTRTATVTLTGGGKTATVRITQQDASLTPHYAASTQTWKFGNQTWSDAICMPECDKTTFSQSYTDPACRNYSSDGNTWYYYNWPYVNTHAATMCPSGWRVPTLSDIISLIQYTTYSTLIKEWGYGGLADGSSLKSVNAVGYYWSSTETDSKYAYVLNYYPGGLYQSVADPRLGFQVRCVK